ncbi:anhydro-N-acetylmuramic acid kinase [Faunimonas pinastri]|uniref:Anhydro-N-acetylmuramic acid kinase n=1 Tax=Faunimonas pinastri TaxID=1855383 RepID=A0A1H9CX91_9HYPH|nr:anhydro-N-acetylmuramic acid kinase [Faunimonas pinastri]SEQ05805.1 anhydro-N-acetylmuramic acid kinase [Faunimonas pinastri]
MNAMTTIRTVIGLMSGTSMDGIDVALIRTDGEAVQEFGPSASYPFTDADRETLRAALGEARALDDRAARPGVLGTAEELVTGRHAEAVTRFLAERGIAREDVALVGFHGQTVFHDPARKLTVQIGDGEALAQSLQLPVAWDFRADDVAAGGQGAPLVPIFHRALMATAGLTAPAVFVNIGGVSNVTFIGRDDALLAFDTGPGNALMDDWTRERTGRAFDADGELAASGTVETERLARLLSHDFFDVTPPKSLDRDAFSSAALAGLSDADGATTLLHFTARSIARAAEHFPEAAGDWVVCGGGRHNRELMRVLGGLVAQAGGRLRSAEDVGLDGDATEAQAFAYLAARTADGKPISFPGTTGAPVPLTGGRISRPSAQR